MEMIIKLHGPVIQTTFDGPISGTITKDMLMLTHFLLSRVVYMILGNEYIFNQDRYRVPLDIASMFVAMVHMVKA